ncbi:hypothetical protein H0H81_003853, partial [Sphagnurus paluster]
GYVETAKKVKVTAQAAGKSLAQRIPAHALVYLRNVSKAYVAVIPGAEIFVDSTFDCLEEVVNENSEEASAIVLQTLQEVQSVVNTKQEGLPAATEIVTILKKHLGELHAVGRMGSDTFGSWLEKVPGVGQKLEELRAQAESHVSEINLYDQHCADIVLKARTMAHEARQGSPGETLKQVSSFLKEKTSAWHRKESSTDGLVREESSK